MAELSGLQKAAVVIVELGPDRAAAVLAHLKETEIEEVMAEVVRLQTVDAEVAQVVLAEFVDMVNAHSYASQGGLAFAEQMLRAGMDPARASEIMNRLKATLVEVPFQFLQRADARQLLSFLREEHPQTIALVLAHLPAPLAAVVLSGVTGELQGDVAHRIAVMDATSPDIIREVERALERRFSSVVGPGEMTTVGGLEPLVDIINRSDRATERLILEGLESIDQALADAVRARMFVFEDIASLDDRSVQLVLRSVESADLALALKGVREDVRQAILRNISTRAAENLVEEIELLGPTRLTVVEEAQAKIVQSIRALEESGQIVLQRGTDEEVMV
jgi:flagellar motor switch protein FliG